MSHSEQASNEISIPPPISPPPSPPKKRIRIPSNEWDRMVEDNKEVVNKAITMEEDHRAILEDLRVLKQRNCTLRNRIIELERQQSKILKTPQGGSSAPGPEDFLLPLQDVIREGIVYGAAYALAAAEASEEIGLNDLDSSFVDARNEEEYESLVHVFEPHGRSVAAITSPSSIYEMIKRCK